MAINFNLSTYSWFKDNETVIYGSRATSASVNKATLFLKKELDGLYNYTKIKFSSNPLEWDAGTTYEIGDVASHNGTIYQATAETVTEPPSADWEIFNTSSEDLSLKYVSIGDSNYIGSYDHGSVKGMIVGSDSTNAISTPKNGLIPWDNGSSSSLGTSSNKFNNIWSVNGNIGTLTSTNISSTDITSSTIEATTMTADLFDGKSTSAEYADLAERYDSDKVLVSGIIAGIGGEKEITLFQPGMPLAGVISTNPAFKMNDIHNDNEFRPFVALKGKVPCKVSSPVRKGQYIIAGKDGLGYGVISIPDNLRDSVVGIALEDSIDNVVNIKV